VIVEDHHRRGRTVVLVEDNPTNQRVAQLFLERAGCDVVLAADGREALALVQERRPDLVLMDVQMPEMDGFQATAAIRAKERQTGRHLPVVAMTAHAMAGDREKCLLAGMDDYVSKPLKPVDLFQALERAVERAGKES
jgi:CheY-like chemotaxis protein